MCGAACFRAAGTRDELDQFVKKFPRSSFLAALEQVYSGFSFHVRFCTIHARLHACVEGGAENSPSIASKQPQTRAAVLGRVKVNLCASFVDDCALLILVAAGSMREQHH
jgi:hypothetical protein